MPARVRSIWVSSQRLHRASANAPTSRGKVPGGWPVTTRKSTRVELHNGGLTYATQPDDHHSPIRDATQRWCLLSWSCTQWRWPPRTAARPHRAGRRPSNRAHAYAVAAITLAPTTPRRTRPRRPTSWRPHRRAYGGHADLESAPWRCWWDSRRVADRLRVTHTVSRCTRRLLPLAACTKCRAG